jgi:hypothetical protein
VLLAVLRRLLKPKRGAMVVLSTLRRGLRMAGLDPKAPELVAAVLEVGGRPGRMGPSGGDRRRVFVDVEMRLSMLQAAAAAVAGPYYRQLEAEGLTPEPPRDKTANGYAVALQTRAAIGSAVQDALGAYLEARADDITPEDTEVLRLYVEGVPIRDVAARLGLPYVTARDCIARHRARAGLGLPPRLLRARKYLEDHVWMADPVHERAVWEQFAQGDGYKTIARATGLSWREVLAIIAKHKVRAGIALG